MKNLKITQLFTSHLRHLSSFFRKILSMLEGKLVKIGHMGVNLQIAAMLHFAIKFLILKVTLKKGESSIQ